MSFTNILPQSSALCFSWGLCTNTCKNLCLFTIVGIYHRDIYTPSDSLILDFPFVWVWRIHKNVKEHCGEGLKLSEGDELFRTFFLPQSFNTPEIVSVCAARAHLEKLVQMESEKIYVLQSWPSAFERFRPTHPHTHPPATFVGYRQTHRTQNLHAFLSTDVEMIHNWWLHYTTRS